ncbi:hypothetical protein UFOVP531_58 [uncultured Caudovirales phage]|jgi:uncharacterized membrane protein YiaA|uniref:Uncharacterized protein n=1 Tax=uncultured Caudovirales phage TaxID=2100421 RepID=A0A6J5MRW8_9CAUD|nr:hypothetical protein UFOVP531_58 [uncultured Caudovirales phage]
MSRQQFDYILNKLISRKLLVFLIACIGLFNQTLTSSDWVVIATAYIGIQGFTEIVTQLRK